MRLSGILCPHLRGHEQEVRAGAEHPADVSERERPAQGHYLRAMDGKGSARALEACPRSSLIRG